MTEKNKSVARQRFFAHQITVACRVRGVSLVRGCIICHLEKKQSVPEKSVVQEGMSLVRGSFVRGFTVYLYNTMLGLRTTQMIIRI